MPKHMFIGNNAAPEEIIYDTMLAVRVTAGSGAGQPNFMVWDGTDLDGQIDTITQYYNQPFSTNTGHIVFSPDRKTVWASARGSATNVWQWAVWDTTTWARIRSLNVSGRWGAWSPNGNYFAVSNNLGSGQPTRVYDSNYSQIATFRHNPLSNFTGGKLSFNADGTKIADSEGGKIYVTEVGNWGNFFEVVVGGFWAVFHPTNPDLLLCGNNVVDISGPPGTIINTLNPAPFQPQDYVFSPVGDRLAVACYAQNPGDQIVKIYRTTDWNDTIAPSPASFPAGTNHASGVDWSHDGEKLAVTFWDDTSFNPARAGVNTYNTGPGFLFAGSPINPTPPVPFGQINYVAWG